jgi:hypothetical protein
MISNLVVMAGMSVLSLVDTFWGVMSGVVAIATVPLLGSGSIESDPTVRVRGWCMLQGMWLTLLGLLAGGAVYWRGGELPQAFGMGGVTMGLWASVMLLSEVTRPLWYRHRSIGQAESATGSTSIWHFVRGVASADPIIVPRLLGALGERRLATPRPANERQHIRLSIEAEMRRFRRDRVPEIVVGRAAVRWNNAAALISQLAANGADPLSLPRVLQGAVALEYLVEAVCVFRGIAVVLPIGAPTTLEIMPPGPTARWRRSRRPPWWPTLQTLDDPSPWLGVAIDLAPTPRLADRQIARRIARLGEPVPRYSAISALGVDRFMSALAPRPVQEDGFGRLYQIGPREAPSAFVEVDDRVLGPDGKPLRHWISVPPHMATAREAVAWTFGMGEAEYQPTHES